MLVLIHFPISFFVSEDTIRRDINELEAESLIIKIKGGAMTKAYHHSSATNQVYSGEAKQIIAQKRLNYCMTE